MITLILLKAHINNKFNVKLESKSRVRNVVYLRSIYTHLALKYITKISLEKIGESINKNHASVIHYRDNVFDKIKMYEPILYDFYKNFNELSLLHTKSIDYGDLLVRYKLLLNSHIDLQCKLEKQKPNINNKKFINILNSVPDDKLDLFYFRIKPIAKMLNSHKLI